MRTTFTTLAAAAVLGLSGAASATITFTDSRAGGNPEENLLLDENDGASDTIFGTTNQTDTRVTIRSDENLLSNPRGQAQIQAEDMGFTFLEIFLTEDNLGFDDIEFNLDASADGSIMLTGTDQFGATFMDTFDLDANGQNAFSAMAIDGQMITNLTLNSTVDLENIRQIRLGGISEFDDGDDGDDGDGGEPTPVPAPGALALLGLGLVGLGAARRRRS